jgi:hypothetical protein
MAKKKLPKEFFRTIARLGGKRKTAKKVAAGRRNLERARAARWAK